MCGLSFLLLFFYYVFSSQYSIHFQMKLILDEDSKKTLREIQKISLRVFKYFYIDNMTNSSNLFRLSYKSFSAFFSIMNNSFLNLSVCTSFSSNSFNVYFTRTPTCKDKKRLSVHMLLFPSGA